eukprot:m.270650 g.270650  ORF g.270650 m.270650 type:complete len:56 (+) comp40543_c0_seq135:2656-2823(+)
MSGTPEKLQWIQGLLDKRGTCNCLSVQKSVLVLEALPSGSQSCAVDFLQKARIKI